MDSAARITDLETKLGEGIARMGRIEKTNKENADNIAGMQDCLESMHDGQQAMAKDLAKVAALGDASVVIKSVARFIKWLAPLVGAIALLIASVKSGFWLGGE